MWAVFLLAAAVRLLYVHQLSGTVFFAHPVVDAEYFDNWAREILRSGAGHEGVLFRAPLYPYFLALVYRLTGGSYLAPRVVQSLLGALTALLSARLALRVTGSRAAAIAAGTGVALHGMLVYLDGELLAESLFIPLFIASLLLYARHRSSGGDGSLAAAGLLAGLAAVTRPSSLAVLPVLAADLVAREFRDGPGLRPGSPTRVAWKLLVAGLPLLLVVAPVTLHNLSRGDLVPIASQGGVNFYIGNNPEADGLHAHLPGRGVNWDPADLVPPDPSGAGTPPLKPSQVSRLFRRAALDFILEQPGDAARLLLKKTMAFWSRKEVSNNRSLHAFREETGILPLLALVGFWLLGPPAILGLWRGVRERSLPPWFVGAILLYALGVVTHFVSERFRAPVIPLLWVAAAAAVLPPALPLSRRRRIEYATVLGLSLLLVELDPWRLERENPAHAPLTLGAARFKAGDLEGAEEAFRRALVLDPSLSEVSFHLGLVAHRREELASAADLYRRELAVNRRHASAWNNLGAALAGLGDPSGAAEAFRQALALRPRDGNTAANLARALHQDGDRLALLGRSAEAALRFREAAAADPPGVVHLLALAQALERGGEPGSAAATYRRILELEPAHGAASAGLGRTADEKKVDSRGDGP
jgi:tetratricopeptide (TPR) repeat protein